MSTYAGLAGALAAQKGDVWKAGFDEIERLIGRKLPASAYKYPAWWSNNPSNNAMTKIWLKAGWRTEQVDVPGRSVVFRRAEPRDEARRAGGTVSGATGVGFGDRPRDFEYASAGAAPQGGGSVFSPPLNDGKEDPLTSVEEFMADLPKDHPLADLFGFLKGTITLAPGGDPCAPAYTHEEWKEAEAEMEAEWDELYGPNSDLAKDGAKGAKAP